MESGWPVSKVSTESVGSRRELVANCVHTADADAMRLDSCVASALGLLHKCATPQDAHSAHLHH